MEMIGIQINTPNVAAKEVALLPKDIEKQYGKDTAHLIKHLNESKEATYTPEQALAGIHRLRALHMEMDQAVLEAYGWAFDTAQAPSIQLRHDFYEVNYLPENDGVRYTIHPEARREVLKRLLELNHRVYAKEVERGLHDKKGGKARKKPAENVTNEPEAPYGKQGKLF